MPQLLEVTLGYLTIEIRLRRKKKGLSVRKDRLGLM